MSFRSESGLNRSQSGSPWRGQGLESGNLVYPEPGLTLPSTPQSHRAGGRGTGSRQCPFPACHPATLLPPDPVSPTGHLHVSMAATNLENQLHSAQKNLLFLQREHASTLKGLHAEIRRLQQHCTGMGVGAPSNLQGPGHSRGGQSQSKAEPVIKTISHWLPPELCQGSEKGVSLPSSGWLTLSSLESL